MDCSKTEVFLAEWKRFCTWHFKKHNGEYKVCEKCLLRKDGAHCNAFVTNHPEEAIKMIQEWSDANQSKTRLSVLKEAFPNAKYCKDGQPEACAEDLFGISCPIYEKDYIADNECEKCWNTPIEDGENNG